MAPLNLSDSLGPKVDLQSGRWIPNSEAYLTALSGAMSQRRLLLAQVSDLYLVRWFMQVTSASVAGAAVTPRVHFWGDWEVGNGKALTQDGTPMAAVSASATSSAWIMIRSANSDVFVSTASVPAGVAPQYNLYVSISRPS